MQTITQQIEVMINAGQFEIARKTAEKHLPLCQGLNKAKLQAQIARSFSAQWRFADSIPLFEVTLTLLHKEKSANDEWNSLYIDVLLEYCYPLHATRSYPQFARNVSLLKKLIDLKGNIAQEIRYLKVVYMDILVRYRWFKLPDEAFVVCQSIIRLAKKQGILAVEVDGLNNLSFAYMLNKQMTSARLFALEALTLLEKEDNNEARGTAYAYLCMTFRFENDLVSLKYWHGILNEHVNKNNNLTSRALCDSMLAYIYYRKGNFGLAEKISQTVFDFMASNQFPFIPICSLLLLSIKLKKNHLSGCVQQIFILLHPEIQRIPDSMAFLLRNALREYYSNNHLETKRILSELVKTADSLGYL